MTALFYEDHVIKEILKGVKTVAMVGCSPKWNRPSNFAMKYLQGKGYRVIPVNPIAAGQSIWGEKVYASLQEIPDSFQMVDIFRSSEAAGPITDEAIKLAKEKGVTTIWMQLGVRNDDAEKKALKAGLKVVMDRCPKIEYGRLYGELGWSGVNSGIISSKRPEVTR